MTYRYGRPQPLALLFARIDTRAAIHGDPQRAMLEEVGSLSERQAQVMFDLLWKEGAPLRGGGLGFSKREADVLDYLAARLQRPLEWEHVHVGPYGGMKQGKGRYVEESK